MLECLEGYGQSHSPLVSHSLFTYVGPFSPCRLLREIEAEVSGWEHFHVIIYGQIQMQTAYILSDRKMNRHSSGDALLELSLFETCYVA